MDLLIKNILGRISECWRRLSIVSNPDGWLAMDSVRDALYQEAQIKIVTGSSLTLRVHFETEYKDHPEQRYVYIVNSGQTLLPDILKSGVRKTFNLSDLFPRIADKSALIGLDMATLSKIYDKQGLRYWSGEDIKALVRNVKQDDSQWIEKSGERFLKQWTEVTKDWNQWAKTISSVADCYAVALNSKAENILKEQIASLNSDFQEWLDGNYLATLNSSHLLWPKSVNKILPYLAEKHRKEDRVALIVVDGFSYWQYTALHQHLHSIGLNPKEGATLAWLPTITMLSRQAIFRGSAPTENYKQSPESEKKLWRDFWMGQGFSYSAIQYLSDKDDFAINEGVTRLAYVTVEMDEKMHSSTDYIDLMALTKNWVPRMAEKILMLHDLGFTIYLTTDHGNMIAEGALQISTIEKTFLYKDGSRGKRHLIFNEREALEKFLDDHAVDDLSVFAHDKWLAMRDAKSFDRKGEKWITHGGSHFWEVVIPLITME